MRYSTRVTIAGAAVAGLFVAPFAGVRAAAVETDAAPDARRQYPACATEDSANCIRRNHGPGYSTVHGPNRHPAPRYFRVSDRIAEKLLARRGTWKRPGNLIGVTVDRIDAKGGTFVVNRETVVSFGDTTYFIRNGMPAGT